MPVLNLLIFLKSIMVVVASSVLFGAHLCGQDTLTVEQLAPLTHAFTITNDGLSGPGAHFLETEIAEAQYFLIGEYHDSRRISEFTSAAIKLADLYGYRRLGLEVGPETGQLLNDSTGPVLDSLRQINDTYRFRDSSGYALIPIPFFKHTEDAVFLQNAKDREWDIFGIDQEFLYGYKMLITHLHGKLEEPRKTELAPLYAVVQDSLQFYSEQYADRKIDLFRVIADSEAIQQYFALLSVDAESAGTVEAINRSSDIYALRSDRQWFENNRQRVLYMKQQLMQQLRASSFDFTKDKLMMKMGGYHLSKGQSPLRLFEVGNMLSELAESNGHTALNVCFVSRYYTEDGEVVDINDSDNEYDTWYKDLLNVGRKNEWVVIDLRPLIPGANYYPIKYTLSETVRDLAMRYDLLIIPATETDATPNYTD